LQLPERTINVNTGTPISSTYPQQLPVLHCPSVSEISSPEDRENKKTRKKDPLALKVWITININGENFHLRALIDTGAEVNIIRKGIIPHQLLSVPSRLIMLSGADSTQLKGGQLSAKGTGTLEGTEMDTKQPMEIIFPIELYEANIATQAILSYRWLAEQNLSVEPRRHRLCYRDHQVEVSIPGIRSEGEELPLRADKVVSLQLINIPWNQPVPIRGQLPVKQDTQENCGGSTVKQPIAQQPEIVTEEGKTWCMLDLFSGTGSTAAVFRDRGFEVPTFDFNPKYNPDILTYILEWDYTAYPAGYFDVIAASPPCTEYSTAMTCRKRNLAHADAIVERTLVIIHYLNPDMWFVENPRGGLLKTRDCMKRLPYVDLDYCQFSDWGYQKPTRIWGRGLGKLPNRLCDGRTCKNMTRRYNGQWAHKRIIGGTPPPGTPRVPLDDQYRIPKGIIEYIMKWDQEPQDPFKYWKVKPRPPSTPPPPDKPEEAWQPASAHNARRRKRGAQPEPSEGKTSTSYSSNSTWFLLGNGAGKTSAHSSELVSTLTPSDQRSSFYELSSSSSTQDSENRAKAGQKAVRKTQV